MVQEGNFDPYYKWLGIPPEEQPPNHYRLLAVRLYETDIEVIESAADQRMTYVQQLATGPYCDLSQTLLNELAAARVCLLNSDSKSEYDISLRKLLVKVRKRAWMVIGVAAVTVGFASWGTYRLLNSDGSAVTVAKDDTTTLVPEVAAGTRTSSKETKVEKAAPSSTKKDMGATEPSAKPGRPPLAIAPFDTAKAKQHQQAWADHLGTPVETTNSIGMKLAFIPAGEFEKTQHLVKITKPFYVSIYEVTQQQYEKVMGTNPSVFKGPQNPVDNVNWDEAVAFCRKLSDLPAEKKAGYVYRLPTEAEWEYACRTGTTTKYSFGDSDSELGDYAWYVDNSGRTSHPVGGKKPNGFGLYDMHGNVWEWCQDWYGDYPSGSVTDPTGPSSGSRRVDRGGSWSNLSGNCRSAFRVRTTPVYRYINFGFRVLRSSIK